MVCRRRIVDKGLLHVIHRHQRRLVRAGRRRCSPMLQACRCAPNAASAAVAFAILGCLLGLAWQSSIA